ncbi:hypothetical protein PCE1_002520 [Barthelona sp. PCE]
MDDSAIPNNGEVEKLAKIGHSGTVLAEHPLGTDESTVTPLNIPSFLSLGLQSHALSDVCSPFNIVQKNNDLFDHLKEKSTFLVNLQRRRKISSRNHRKKIVPMPAEYRGNAKVKSDELSSFTFNEITDYGSEVRKPVQHALSVQGHEYLDVLASNTAGGFRDFISASYSSNDLMELRVNHLRVINTKEPRVPFPRTELAPLQFDIATERTAVIHSSQSVNSDTAKVIIDEHIPTREELLRVERCSKGLWNFVLDLWQRKAVFRIDQGHSVFVTAHTSAGKTVVAEFAIKKALTYKRSVVYTGPVKALVNQKYFDFCNKFGKDNVGILTGDTVRNPQANCIVMTTEVLQSMLYNRSKFILEIETVIFDEFHNIKDRDRGKVYEDIIAMIPRNVNFVLLTATISTQDRNRIANWIAMIKNKLVYIEGSTTRPVPLYHKLIIPVPEKRLKPIFRNNVTSLCMKNYSAVSLRHDGFGKHAFNSVVFQQLGGAMAPIERQPPCIVSAILAVEKSYPLICFIFSKRKCNDVAEQLSRRFSGGSVSPRFFSLWKHMFAQLSPEDQQLENIRRMYAYLVQGIGVHHSGLHPVMKEFVEFMMKENMLKVVIATSTLGQGINMPARSVMITSMRMGIRTLATDEYLQFAGRAGRRGFDKEGIVYMLKGGARTVDDFLSGYRTLLSGFQTPVRSSYSVTYRLLLNCILRNNQVLDILKMTLGEFDSFVEHSEVNEALIALIETEKHLPFLDECSCGVRSNESFKILVESNFHLLCCFEVFYSGLISDSSRLYNDLVSNPTVIQLPTRRKPKLKAKYAVCSCWVPSKPTAEQMAEDMDISYDVAYSGSTGFGMNHMCFIDESSGTAVLCIPKPDYELFVRKRVDILLKEFLLKGTGVLTDLKLPDSPFAAIPCAPCVSDMFNRPNGDVDWTDPFYQCVLVSFDPENDYDLPYLPITCVNRQLVMEDGRNAYIEPFPSTFDHEPIFPTLFDDGIPDLGLFLRSFSEGVQFLPKELPVLIRSAEIHLCAMKQVEAADLRPLADHLVLHMSESLRHREYKANFDHFQSRLSDDTLAHYNELQNRMTFLKEMGFVTPENLLTRLGRVALPITYIDGILLSSCLVNGVFDDVLHPFELIVLISGVIKSRVICDKCYKYSFHCVPVNDEEFPLRLDDDQKTAMASVYEEPYLESIRSSVSQIYQCVQKKVQMEKKYGIDEENCRADKMIEKMALFFEVFCPKPTEDALIFDNAYEPAYPISSIVNAYNLHVGDVYNAIKQIGASMTNLQEVALRCLQSTKLHDMFDDANIILQGFLSQAKSLFINSAD